MKISGFTFLVIFSIIQTILLVYLLVNENKIFNNQPASSNLSTFETRAELVNYFRNISSNLGIDKLYHGYQFIYGTYLGPIRHKPLNFLEIGLGCTMKYGPGGSLLAWRKYLTNPDTKISFVEYDRKCAEKFQPPRVHKLFIGDQSDFEFLERVGKEGGPYDFIVDDGGHKRTFQVNSFLGLWPYVKSNGGIYVLEDLFFTYYKGFNNSDYSSIDMVNELIMLMNDANSKGNHMLPVNYTFNEKLVKIYRSILSVNCFHHGCVFVKA